MARWLRWSRAASAAANVLAFASVAQAQAGHLFLPEETFVGGPAAGVAVADVNTDGFDDVIALGDNAVNERALTVYGGSASGLSIRQTIPTGGFGGPFGESIAIGDFDGDDRLDVVVADLTGVLFFAQGASGQLAAPVAVSSGEATLLRAGDFNSDDLDDVVALDWGTGTVDVLLQGATGLGAPDTYSVTHEGYEDLEIGDLDGDGRDDIVVMSGQGLVDHVGALLQRDVGFAAATYANVADHRGPRGLGVGDLTGDGNDDVVISFSFERDFALIPHTASGFEMPEMHQILGALGDVSEIRDLTGDGLPDLLFLPSGVTLAQSPDGTLVELAATPAFVPGPHGAAIGDIDGDDLLDLVVPIAEPGGVRVSFGTEVALSVTASVDPEPALATEEATFTAEVRNDGPDDATEVVLSLEPDEELGAFGLESDDGTCDFRSCDLGTLAAGASATVTFVARPSDVGMFGADVSVAAYNFDADASDDSTRATLTVLPAADLSVGLAQTYRMSGSVDGALVIVGNDGPHDAESVRVTIELESGLSYQGYEGGDGAPAPASCSDAGSVITCVYDSLSQVDLFENPELTQIHLLLSGSGTLTASIESDTGDPDLSNNDAELALREASGTSGEAEVGPSGSNGAGDDGGCGCRAASGRTVSHGGVPLLLGAVIASRARRKRKWRPGTTRTDDLRRVSPPAVLK